MQAYREETTIYGKYMRTDIKHILKHLKGLQEEGMITAEEYANAENNLQQRILQKPANETKTE